MNTHIAAMKLARLEGMCLGIQQLLNEDGRILPGSADRLVELAEDFRDYTTEETP